MIKKFFISILFLFLSGLFYGEDYKCGFMSISDYNFNGFEPDFRFKEFNPAGERGKSIFEAVLKKPVYSPPRKQSSRGGGPSALNIFGYILIAAGAGGLGAGYYFDTQAAADYKDAQSKYDDYKNASSGFDDKWKAYMDKMNLVKQDVQYRNYGYIGGGVALGLGIVLAFIPSGKNYRIYITPESINAVYKF